MVCFYDKKAFAFFAALRLCGFAVKNSYCETIDFA